jgi:hypothetical protein
MEPSSGRRRRSRGRQDHLDVRLWQGMREIRGDLENVHGIDVSPDLVSAITDTVLGEVAE